MEKNISLKVSYQETNRRFAISKYTNWFELETAIRTLFSFPSTFTFALTYTDEDCDIITLRSDLELQDVLAQHQSSTLKFTVVPCDTQIRSCEDSNHEVTGYNISNPVIESPRLFSSIETNEDEVYFPEFKSDEKGKNKADYSFEKQNSSNHPETSSYDEQQNDEEQTITPPSIVLAAQFQKLVDQFRPLIEQQPQLMEQANDIMDQILRNMNVDIEKLTQWFKNQIANVQQNFSGTNTRSLEGEFQRIIQSGQNIAQSVRGIIPVKRCSSHHMTEEEKNEKLKLLREMGFWDDDQRNERLLKKYHGNINKVTEDLLRERNDTAEYTFIENEVQMEPIIFSNH